MMDDNFFIALMLCFIIGIVPLMMNYLQATKPNKFIIGWGIFWLAPPFIKLYSYVILN